MKIKLKKINNIPYSKSLILLKFETYYENTEIKNIQYEIYNPITKQKITDLSVCDNDKTNIEIEVKKGNVDIVATNPVTKETYTVVFRMTENPKTFNSFLFFSIIFMMISFLTFLICIPKKRSIY